MANKKGNIRFGVGFDIDKSGLEQLKASLASLSHIDKFDLIDANADIKELNEIKSVAEQVGFALQKSFNQNLGTYNIQTFKKELANANLTTQTIGKTFAQAGEKGKIAFRDMVSAISSTKLELRETHNILDKMGETLSNTIRWSIASTAINAVTGSVQKAWDFTKKLDTSLNDIRIVTGKSADEMDRFAVKANMAAKSLGANTKAYSDAALIYYQQGLNDTDAQARADVTVKAANVTGQSAQAVSEQLTAVWNGYKVSAEESEKYIDKLAAVAASTAADLEELSTGMSRVASAANVMGVDIDQLNAQLATIVSVTREAPESIGTALKTVYARMSDIEAGLDTETTLGEYTSQMAEMGINVLDAKGNLRDMGDVVEEIGGKWNTLNREQQVSLAQSIAGTRQYSRMMALFDNWDQYEAALTTSQTSMGALQKQQDIYMESLEAHLNKLTASSERLYSKLLDSDSFKTFIDIASGAVDVLGSFVESLGGGGTVLMALLPTLTNVFSKNIAQGLSTTITNIQNATYNTETLKNALVNVRSILDTFGDIHIDEVATQFATMKEQLIILRQQGILTNEEFSQMSDEFDNIITLADKASILKNERNVLDKQLDSGVAVGENVRLQDIYNATVKADESKANQLVEQISSDVIARYENFSAATVATDTWVEPEDDDVSYDQKIAALKEYMLAYQEAAQLSGLLSAEEQENLQREIALLDQATTEAQEKRQAELAQKQEELLVANQALVEAGEGPQADAAQIRVDKLSQEITLLKRVIKGYSNQETTLTRLTKSTKAAANTVVSSVEKNAKNIQATAKKVAKGVEAEADRATKNAINKAQRNLKKINLTGVLNQVTKITSSIGQMGAAIGVLQNLGDIWRNDDLATGQKLLQTIINITSAIGLMLPLLTSFKGLWMGITGAIQTHNAVSAIMLVAKGKEAAASAGSVIAKMNEVAATKFLAEVKEDLSQETYDLAMAELTEKGVISSATGAIIAETLAKKVQEKTTKSATAAKWAENAAWYASPIIWIVGIILAAVAATALLTVGIVALAKALSTSAADKAAEDAKKATEHANAMAEAYKKVKSEYDALKASIEDYKNAQKAIDEMVAGTDEWRNAIADANTQVMELIKQYPDLAAYMSNEGGRLTISEEGLAKVEETKRQEVNIAQRSSLLAQQRASEANLYAKQMNTHEDINGTVSTKEGTTTGAIIGGILGVGFGPLGAAVGAAIGGAIGKVAAKDTTTEEQTQELANILAKSPDAFATEEAFAAALEGTEFASMATELWENRAALEELTNATRAAEAEQAALRQQIALSMLQENAIYQGLMDTHAELAKEKANIKREDYSSAKEYYEAQAAQQAKIDEAQQDIDVAQAMYSSKGMQAKIQSDAANQVNDEWGAASREEREAMVKEYWSKKLGIPTDDIEVKSVGKDGKYKVRWRGEDGEFTEQEKNQTKDMLKGLADMRASEYEISEADLQDRLKKWNSLQEVEQKAFETFVGDGEGDFSKLTTTEFKEIAKGWENIDWDDIEADPALKAKLREKAEALGLDTTDEALKELLQGITDGIENYNRQEEKIDNLFLGRNAAQGDDAIFDDQESLDTFNSFSQETRLKWANLWHDLAMSTEEGSETANLILSKLSSNNAGLINAAFDNVNWKDSESVKEFSEAMEEAGMTADEAAETVYQMRYAMGAIEEFDPDAAASKFTNLQKVMSSLNEAGDTIEADMYDQLSSEMQDYFVRMGDGTYKLIGSAEAFKAAAEAAHKASLYAQLNEQRKKQKDDYAAKTTLTEERKKEIEQEQKQKASSIREQEIDEFSRGSFTSYSDLGDGFFGEVGEWFTTTFTGQGLGGGVPIEDIENANAALNRIRRWKDEIDVSDSDISSWQTQITGGNMGENDFEAFLDAIDKATKAAEDEAKRLESSGNIDSVIKAEQDALVKENAGTKLTISDSEKDIVTQLYGEASSIKEIEQVNSKIDEMYSDANGYTPADRNALKAIGTEYKTAFENQVRNFDAGVDVYRDAEKELAKIEKQLDTLASESELLVEGSQAWLDNLSAQNDALNQQIAKQKQIKALAATEKNNQITDLAAATSIDGKTFNIYDANGNLKSRDTLLQEIQDWTRSADSDVIDLDKINGMVESVNTIYDKIDEADEKIDASEQAIRDAMMTQLENNLAKFEVKIQLTIDSREMQKTFNDFKKSFLDEDAFGEIGKTLNADFNIVADNVNTQMSAIKELNSMQIIDDAKFKAMQESNQQIAANMISASDYEAKRQEILNSLMEEGLSLQEAHAAMLDNIVAYHERIAEAYDEYVSLIEGVNSALEHQKTLLELMYGDKAASRLTDFYNQQITNQDKIMTMRKQEYESAAAQMAVWGTLSEEEQKAVQERYLAASENYFASITDMAQMYQDQYLNTIQAAFDEFTDSFKKDEYDWMVSSSEDFLNGIDSAFGLQSAERAFDKSINANTSISAQAKLNKLREEELAKLREKDKLTKYDLDRAQKRLAVAQAEIALQEAQANKSKMRLVRGADGTYSYQYEADMDAISKAEEDLAKANQDLVSLDQQELKSNYDKAWELVQEYYSKIQELDPVKDADEIAKLQEEYGARIEALGLNASTVYKNLKASVAEAGEFLGQQFTIETDFAWADSDFAKAIMGFDSEGSAWTNLTATVSGAAGTLAENLQTLDSNLEEAIEAYKKVVDEQLVPATETTIGNLEDLAGPGGALDQLRSAATIAATALEQAAASITATVGVNQYLNTGIRENQSSSMASTHGGFTYRINDTAEWNAYIESLFGENGSLKLTDEQKAAFAEKYGYTDGDFDEFIRQITDDEYIWASNYDILTKLIAAKQAGTFDTGGYTGAWGSEGRAAILHEKELVLNQQDTRNILAAVDIARQLENALSASLLERIVDLMTYNYTERLNELRQTAELKQDVHITAEFPNATDRNEIEAAFDELINLATQKIYEN